MRAKLGVLEQTQGLHLAANFYLNVFIVLASRGQKKTILGQIAIMIWCQYRDIQYDAIYRANTTL